MPVTVNVWVALGSSVPVPTSVRVSPFQAGTLGAWVAVPVVTGPVSDQAPTSDVPDGSVAGVSLSR